MDANLEPDAPSRRAEEVRAVDNFTRHMLCKLRVNSDKGRWHTVDFRYLMRRLREEVEELQAAVDGGRKGQDIVDECADVANFAMFIADNYGDLS